MLIHSWVFVVVQCSSTTKSDSLLSLQQTLTVSTTLCATCERYVEVSPPSVSSLELP